MRRVVYAFLVERQFSEGKKFVERGLVERKSVRAWSMEREKRADDLPLGHARTRGRSDAVTGWMRQARLSFRLGNRNDGPLNRDRGLGERHFVVGMEAIASRIDDGGGDK